MASPSTPIRPTPFPRLDTLSTDLQQTRDERSLKRRYQRRQHNYAGNAAAQPKGKTAMLQDFSRFVASFTGEAEVCYQFALRTSSVVTPEIVQATVASDTNDASSDDGRQHECILETSQTSTDDLHFDFGFEILADPEVFDSIDLAPVLNASFVVQYHATQLSLVMLYDPHCFDEYIAEIAWHILINQLSRNSDGVGLSPNHVSVLNHPPLMHPPPLAYSAKGTLPVALLHAGFQRSAARCSERNALHFQSSSSSGALVDEIFTYSQLDDLTTSLALRLRSTIAPRPEGPTAVPAFMSNSAAFYVSWLAVLKAGFAFCPLPVDAPPEQLRGIVEEVGASVILTNGPQVGGRPWDAWYCDDDELATCLDVKEFVRNFQANPEVSCQPLPEIQETDLAYVMYTSGSTGKPKGVKIHHHAAACSIGSHSKDIPASFFKDGFRWLQFAAPTSDPSIMEIFTTWWTGGTLCGTPRDVLLTDPQRAINQLSATIMMATPSTASVLRPEKVPTLRHLWTMGKKLTPKVIKNFSYDSPENSPIDSHTPRLQITRRLLNAYGPTEGSINCNIVANFSHDERGSITGQPIDTCSILVIDPERRKVVPVPLGFSGELAIGRPEVSQGYLNRPEQTATAFVTSSTYGRLYRTGDRARVVKTKSGELTVEFLGRLTSDQVKLSGRRVELGQIESTIASVPGVTDAVAIVHQHSAVGQGSEQIVVCVVTDGVKAEPELVEDARKAAEKSLARFRRPARYFVLTSMPRSRSGKTDRKALTGIVNEKWETTSDGSRGSSDSGYDPGLAQSIADNAMLSLVIDALADVCDVDATHITPSTQLLSLGLDSLRAVRLLQQLRDKGISHLNVARVASSRTVYGLAVSCTGDVGDVPSDAEKVDWIVRLDGFSKRYMHICAGQLNAPASDLDRVLPTTATQSGMIASFLRSMSRQYTSLARKRYINHSIYHQAANLDSEKLQQAWHTALTRSDILRAVFTSVDDELAPFAQCILSPSSALADIQVQQYTCDFPPDWDATVQQAQADAEAAIGLERPPFRISIIRSAQRTSYLLSLFHGVFDGRSLELILQDVEDAYFDRALQPRSQIDVAVRKHFSEASDQSVKYWKSVFEDFEPVPFPCVSASKPDTQTPDAQVAEIIGNITLDKISQAAKIASVSPLSLLQAGWATILSAYTGSTTGVSFGSVVSDRMEEDLSSCSAPTFAVVPSRIVQSGSETQSVREMLSGLTSKNVDALPYHHLPLSSLTTAEGILPYDTLLSFQAFDKSAGESSLWTSVDYPPMEHDFAVMIEVWPTTSGPLRLRGTYTHSHLDRLAGETMLRQLDSVVGFLCDNPDRPFYDARFAVDAQLQSQIPMTLGASRQLLESELFLHHAFSQHVATRPHATALLFRQSTDGSLPDIEWSYSKLHGMASSFANRLVHDFGSLKNEPVMICMEKCAELYIAVLGVLLAGAGWCPIDPYSPSARQRAIMERTGSRLLLTSPTASNVSVDAVPEDVSQVMVDIDALESNATDAEQHEPSVERHPEDLAYLIFTSGTTGLPKGVPITHRSGAIAMNALTEVIPSNVKGSVVRCMQFSQYTFDVFVQDLFYTWKLGGTVISSTRQLMIQNFADLANDTKATHAHLTPAFSATLARKNIKTLEVITMIGEKLTEAVAADWGTNLRAFNTYGPAEVTVVSTLRQLTGKDDPYHSSNVGIPLPSVGTYVVDSGNNLVMKGAIGELALSGPQLSPGYWKLPDVNAKKFIWSEARQERLYLTGDLVRHLADGTLNFVGRNDDLVKLGGIRVELGEIAFALKDADERIEKFEVLHCKRKDADEKLVVAFMACPSSGESSDAVKAITTQAAKELANVAREYGRKVLPPYMLPTTFIVLPRIPRTASAKVDRATLTAIYHGFDLATWDSADLEGAGSKSDQHAAWRYANEGLLQVIADSLRVALDSLHPASGLPAIGIDSIGAISLIPKINALGYQLSVVDAFKCRTLADLCELANASVVQSARSDQPHLDRLLQSFDARYYSATSAHLGQDDITVIPPTVLQEGLLSESFKDASAYWSNRLFALESNVDLAKLKRAWVKVARQTEALRAGFVAKAMLPALAESQSEDSLSYLQVIYDEPEVGWVEHEPVASIAVAAKTRVFQIAQHHHQHLFKLPPWAVDIFQAQDGTLKMMITIHHSIYDGPSLNFLEQDVQAAYQRGAKMQQRLPLTEAVATQSAVDADNKEAVHFWEEVLQDLAVGAEEQSTTDESSTKLQHRIQYLRGSTTLSDLRATAKELGLTSVVTIFRAAWALLLGELLETPQVLYAEILSDRIVDSKLENVVGPLMSTVPSLFSRKDTVAITLTEHDAFAKKAWQHRNVRPGTIKTLLKRGPSSQVYPAMFAFHPAAVDDDEGQTQKLWQRLPDVTHIEVEHPYAFNVWQDSEDTPRFELAIADQIMTEEEQHLLLRQLDALVECMTKTPDLPLSALPTGLPRELLGITTPRIGTKCPSPFGPTYYVQHFAETHPNWKGAEIALKIDYDETITESWTYAELNDKSNTIAHWILQHGVSKRTIGMCLGRTLVSYAVLLGIMKAGNCYLPIDESLPAERKAFLLEDGSAAMIFATQDVFEGVAFPKTCRLVDPENDRFQQSLTKMSPRNPEIAADPRDDCYLLYTSGSTGKPKGVLVNRGNLASFVEAQSEFICDVTTSRDVAGRGKYMGLASRAFDVHLGEAFLAWRFGLTALTAPRSTLLDDLALALSSLNITHASFVPSLLDQTGLTPEDAPDLVFLGVGGEKMSPKTKKLWGGHDRVGLINAYGPTEATIGCCSNRLFPDSNTNDIGVPLGDSQAHILVPGTDHYALRGMPGELCFTGSLIANGYLNRPDAKGFVEDFHGQRMYRTGDIVKLGIDDHVYFLGRKDDQVKIRGQRVELGEVAEGVRTASKDPIDVATLVVKHPELARVQLVAYIAQAKACKSKTQQSPEIIHTQLQDTNSTLRSACQKTLPSSTVPDLIIPLTYIPLAATSGKADNKMLTQIFSSTSINDLMPRSSNGKSNDAVERAMTEAESTMYEIVASVLKDKPRSVTPGSTLFELGIDSLSGISVFSKLRAAGYNCSIGMVMKNPTLEQLAQSGSKSSSDDSKRFEDVRRMLSEIEQTFLARADLGVAVKDIETVRPCLPLQEVLVAQSMHQDLDGSDGAYVNHRRFELGPGMDIDRLQAAWARLVYDNDILRTCFSTQNDDFLQIVLKPDACGLQWTEAIVARESDIEGFQRQLGGEIVSNLTTKPPVRLRVLQICDQRSILLFSVHHALYDGNSFEMMMHDVRSFYEGSLPQPRPSVVPFIEYLAGQDEAPQRKYWTSLLHDWHNAPLLSESAVKFVTLQTAERHFSRKLSELEGEATKLNVTFATLLQFAFATAMAQSANTNDFIYGNVLSGRAVPVEDVDKIMAPCITTIPQRIKLEDAHLRVEKALTTLQSANSASLEHQHVSPRNIQKWTSADRALYDCLFSFVRLQANATPNATFLKQQGSDIGVDYPLAVEFEADPASDKLIVRAGFTEAFGSSSVAEVLLEKIEILVDAVLQQDGLTVGSLGIPTGEATRNVKKSENYDESTWSPLEEQVRALIAQYASVSERDIHKDTAFIHMGIDSISAIRFAKHLRGQGLKVSSADVVRHNRLGALCKHISSSSDRLLSREEKPITNPPGDDLATVLISHGVIGIDGTAECYECTPLQTGMLAQSLATEGALYMHHHATRCDPGINIARLRLAWSSLVADLDILRTTFHYVPDCKVPWVAAVRGAKSSTWEEVEAADAKDYWLNLSRKSDFIQRIQTGEPLARAQIVKSKESRVLILTLHHAVYDGISLAMLYRQLALRYHGHDTPTTPFYKAARAIASNAKAATTFWADHIRGYTGAPAFLGSEQPIYTLAEREVLSDMKLLGEQCRRADLDIKDVCVVAFGKAMACVYGRRDVVFGQVMAARHGVAGDENEVVGPMFNTVPIRVAIKDQLMTNTDIVTRVHTVHAHSLEYQHASLAEVQKQWRASASDPSAQLIDSIFVYSKVEKQASQGLEVFGQPLESDKSPVPSEYRLNFEIEHTEDGLVARALSSMASAEINILLDNFKGAVHDIINQPLRFATAYPDPLRSLPAEAKPEPLATSSFDQVAVDSYADVIRTAMSEVAQVPADKIALDSSIYSFGIDSIAAIQIVSRCKKAGVRVSVADILKGAMLGRVCEIVHNKATRTVKKINKENGEVELVTVKEVQDALAKLSFSSDDVEDVLPCLPGQHYHLISWLQSGRTLFEPGWCYKSTSSLDANRLRSAWNTLRQRNAVLRTTFAALGPHRALQMVLKSDAVKDDAFVVHEDLTGINLEDMVKSRAHLEARNPSDFFSLPVRLRLVKAIEGDAVMIYVHHSLYDAWSMPRLVSELASIYNGIGVEQGPNFAQLVRHTYASIDKEEERSFWQESMAGREKAIISSASNPHDEFDRRQSFAMVEGGKVSVAQLERLCAAHKISPHHIILLAFARALARMTETSSPLFGFFQLGRSAAFDDMDKVTGPCVNTLPLGIVSVLSRGALELVSELQQLLGARVPFEQSDLRTALGAFDPDATQLPFNAHINLLWNKSSLVGSVAEHDLFKPLAIGVPTDYSSPRALAAQTAIDTLDTSLLPPHQLFVDVGPGENGIVFGARADAALMDAAGIQDFVGRIEDEVLACMDELQPRRAGLHRRRTNNGRRVNRSSPG